MNIGHCSSWACVEEEKKDSAGQERTGKSHKRVIFHLFGKKPRLKRSTSEIVY